MLTLSSLLYYYLELLYFRTVIFNTIVSNFGVTYYFNLQNSDVFQKKENYKHCSNQI